MNLKVSIIIPVFNSEKYLIKCLNSIINQTYNNIEIILINDGSTDNSLLICKKFEEMDKRIKLVNQENKGRSKARNTGLYNATGSYIMFIDSDDWIEDNYVEEMLSLATLYNTDLVVSTISNESEFKKDIQNLPWNIDRLFIEKEIRDLLFPHFFSAVNTEGKKIINIPGSVCKCIYNRSLIEKNEIYFDENLSFGEDKDFNLRVLSNSKRVYTTNNCYYHYNRSILEGGSTTQRFSNKLYQEAKYKKNKYKHILNNLGLLNEYKAPLRFEWVVDVLSAVTKLYYPGTPYNLKGAVDEAEKIYKDSEIYKHIENFTEEQVDLIGKKKIYKMLNHLPTFYLMMKYKIIIKHIIVKMLSIFTSFRP